MPMTGKIVVDWHKLSKFADLAIPLFAVVFFLAGKYISFYFHFLTVAFLFLTGINFFYRYLQRGHVLLRNFGILALGIMTGAIIGHITQLGWEGDRLSLGLLAAGTLCCCLLILFLRRKEMPLIYNALKELEHMSDEK